MSDRLKIAVQHLLPKTLLTELAGKVAAAHGGTLTTSLIRWFVAKYHVDMTEAQNSDIRAYPSFNAFFTRPLKPGVRPMATAEYVCPVDGAISQFGIIDDQHILQAKGHRYTVADLLAGDHDLAERFRHGSFANLYLSPRDYHRLHMPCDGVLKRMIHVPGALYSVNPVTARGVPNLFARNERVICHFESPELGSFVMVLVGATIVGSIATAWHGIVNARRTGTLSQWRYDSPAIMLKKGDEMGRFLLGSTVILLFAPGAIEFNAAWAPENPVRLGEPMGYRPA